MSPIKLYSYKENCQDSYGNSFYKDHILINDIEIIQKDFGYSFLKKIKSPPNYYFLYCMCDTSQKIVKFGQSSSPYKRTIDHANNFMCYGGSSADNLYCIWSRFFFSQNSNIEKELLNEFKNAYPNCPQIAKEFFSEVDTDLVEQFFLNFIKTKHE